MPRAKQSVLLVLAIWENCLLRVFQLRYILLVFDTKSSNIHNTAIGTRNSVTELVSESDIIIVSVFSSITTATLKKIAKLNVKDKLVVDIRSTKVFATRELAMLLPETTAILSTHPLFGHHHTNGSNQT